MEGYPNTYNMMNILNNWNSDETEIPPFHYDSLCHFDYQVIDIFVGINSVYFNMSNSYIYLHTYIHTYVRTYIHALT